MHARLTSSWNSADKTIPSGSDFVNRARRTLTHRKRLRQGKKRLRPTCRRMEPLPGFMRRRSPGRQLKLWHETKVCHLNGRVSRTAEWSPLVSFEGPGASDPPRRAPNRLVEGSDFVYGPGSRRRAQVQVLPTGHHETHSVRTGLPGPSSILEGKGRWCGFLSTSAPREPDVLSTRPPARREDRGLLRGSNAPLVCCED